MGIGYDDSIPFAQEVALKVLAEHPAVLNEPEPLVLVENLGPSTVNLRVYFWLDGGRHSWLKVKSSVIRLVKRAFQDSGISLPDEAREVTFPHGVPVRMIESEGAAKPADPALAKPTAEPETVATKAEAGLQSEAEEIKEQARRILDPWGESLNSIVVLGNFSMDPAIITVLIILIATVVMLIFEIVRIDVVALVCMLALGWTGVLTPQEALSGFSSNAVIAMMAVMILGQGIAKTGIMDRFSRAVLKKVGTKQVESDWGDVIIGGDAVGIHSEHRCGGAFFAGYSQYLTPGKNPGFGFDHADRICRHFGRHLEHGGLRPADSDQRSAA